MKTVEMEVLLADGPDTWEGWPLSRKLLAVARDDVLPNLGGADRVVIEVQRDEYPEDEPQPLSGFMVSVLDTEPPLAIVQCHRLGSGHDASGFYVVVPAVGVAEVISVNVEVQNGE